MGLTTLGVMMAALSAAQPQPASQTPAPAQAPATAARPADTGVTSYPPSFFAPYSPTTAMSMINLLPGFSFDGGGNVRGFSANAGNVLIDGRRPPAGADSLSAILGRIPAGAVLRVDIIRGGAPGIDMQGKSEVANVIRKTDAGVKGSAQVRVPIDSHGDVSPSLNLTVQRQANGQNADASLAASLSDGYGDSQRLRVRPGGIVLQQSASVDAFTYKSLDLTGAFERPLSGGNVRVNAKYTGQNNEGEGDTVIAVPGGGEHTTSSGENQGGEVGLRYSRPLSSGARIEGFVLQQLADSTSLSSFDSATVSSTFGSDRSNGQTVATGTFVLPKRGDWQITGGAEGAYNWFETQSRFRLNGSSVFIPGDVTRVHEERGEAFAAANWTPIPKLTVELAARYERSTITAETSAGDADKTLSYIKPRARLSWRPAMGHEITFTAQRLVGQLSFSDFAVSASAVTGVVGAGNPELEPDKTWLFDARYEHTFGRRGSIVAQYTRRQIYDVLGSTLDPTRAFDIRDNIGPAVRDIFFVTGNIPMDRFGFKNGYFRFEFDEYLSHIEDPVTHERRRMSNDLPYVWYVGLNQDLAQGKWSWSANLQGQGENDTFSPRSITRVAGGVFINGGLTWRPKPDVVLAASASGSLQDRETTFTLYTAPRDVGAVRYTETTTAQNTWNLSLSARKQF